MAASEQDLVFAPAREARFVTTNGFVDLYALLQIARDAAPDVLDEAIAAAGADLLALLFARGGSTPLQDARRQYLPVLRPLLLNPEARRDFDAALAAHEGGLPGPTLAELLERHPGATLQPPLAETFWARLARRLQESEYL